MFVPFQFVYAHVYGVRGRTRMHFKKGFNVSWVFFFFLISESFPNMDQVTIFVAAFASRVHSFDILIESCMHRVAKNKQY